ncbi:transcriptional regulator with XRE-family HTH domain [Nocardiopsis mwathae]|uniref:Transcriptional regulator with XRE-family HTH domain n=1 Tax=Nocardiopsis mwathae TaxID=1472723 RepID=A0A7W9YKV8_9ACTN|nr:helix-turn-helix transcriptional regulator [Nocardiopsis mwathae]MBB6173850.1 transcriptional regulator with XRE-family HTH domain [Nocardiopsis mwathae]
MTEFGNLARRTMEDHGWSLRALAREVNYDAGYLSRVLSGKRRPSAGLARALDRRLSADGALIAAAKAAEPSAPVTDPANGATDEIAHMRAAVDHLVAHDSRYGGDEIAPAAVRVWRSGHRQLDSGTIPEQRQQDFLAAVAEMAEVAGWLLFDADRQDASRTATLEAHMLARHAGDRSMERFALTNLAMQDVEVNRPGEALRIADELLSEPRIPPRVALLARIRRGRALACVGERRRALDELGAARAGLEDSISARDPAWTWWVNDCELSGHEGEALLVLGDTAAALPKLERAAELSAVFRRNGRGSLYYQVSLVQGYAAAHAWRECGIALEALPPALESVSSGRNRRRLRFAVRTITRDPETPLWLSDLARDVAAA